MFGVCATVKRTMSLDTPSNATNQLQSFDDTPFNVTNQLQWFDDTPFNVTNQLQSFDDTPFNATNQFQWFDDTPFNVTNQLQLFDDKENFSLSDLLWLDDHCCHSNSAPNHPVQVLHDSSTSCHSNTMVTRTGGIKKSVQLFNSPYMGVDDKQDFPAMMGSNKKRKLSASRNITMATNTTTRNKPSRNNSCYGNKVK